MSRRLLTLNPKKLRALREACGLDTRELAASVGVSDRMVKYWEEGCYVPEARNLERLARVLGCSVSVLTGTRPGMETLADLRFAAGVTTEQAAEHLRQKKIGRELFISASKLRDLERGRRVRGWKWRDPKYTGQLVQNLAYLYKVPVRMVLDAWLRTRPGDQVPAMPHPVLKSPSTSSLKRWEALNDRQRIYLGEIMRDDRMTETEMWMRRVNRLSVPPAAEWRKLPFAIRAPADLVGYTRIQERLRSQGVHDPGAGATLHALARSGLVIVAEDQVEVAGLGLVDRVVVEITRRGRAAARAGLDEPRERGAPPHLLSDWLWRTVLRVVAAGPTGLSENALAGRSLFYLAVGYKPAPDAQPNRGFIESRPVMSEDGSHVLEYRWHLTELGRRHVVEYLDQYRDLYPYVKTDFADGGDPDIATDQ